MPSTTAVEKKKRGTDKKKTTNEGDYFVGSHRCLAPQSVKKTGRKRGEGMSRLPRTKRVWGVTPRHWGGEIGRESNKKGGKTQKRGEGGGNQKREHREGGGKIH